MEWCSDGVSQREGMESEETQDRVTWRRRIKEGNADPYNMRKTKPKKETRRQYIYYKTTCCVLYVELILLLENTFTELGVKNKV